MTNRSMPPISRRTLLTGAAGAATLAVAPGLRAPAIAQNAPLKVGLMLPYTGTYARLGKFIDDGFRLYVERKGGKLGGREIAFVQVDDESKPAAATDNMNRLVGREKVDVVVGTVHSGVAMAMVKVAREVASKRVDPADPAGDARLLAIPEIGPWSIACLALRGRGEPDALLAGDLAQVKLVGFLEGLGRLAEVPEVEEFYRRYAPWRGLAGEYMTMAYGSVVHGPGNRNRIREQALRHAA